MGKIKGLIALLILVGGFYVGWKMIPPYLHNYELKDDLDEIARGLAAARPVSGRCIWRTVGDVKILDDTYNANPVSVRAGLDTLVWADAARYHA